MTLAARLTISDVWAELGYRAACPCATCRRRAYCRGVNPDSRVCIECLEFVHGCQPPNMRRRRRK